MAFQAAELLGSAIPLDKGDAHHRIDGLLQAGRQYKATGDGAAWMLKAMEERVNAQNPPGLKKLRQVIGQASELLPLATPTLRTGKRQRHLKSYRWLIFWFRKADADPSTVLWDELNARSFEHDAQCLKGRGITWTTGFNPGHGSRRDISSAC